MKVCSKIFLGRIIRKKITRGGIIGVDGIVWGGIFCISNYGGTSVIGYIIESKFLRQNF